MRCAHTLTTLATVAWATALPAADSSHSLAPLDGARWQRMEPSVPQVAHSGWESAGRCRGTELLNVTFFLKHSTEQARLMQDRLLAVSDPASRAYGQHLTQEDVARLAATPEAAARVRGYLLDAGVLASQMRMGATRDSLTLASVSCGLLERLLSTTLHQYTPEAHTQCTHSPLSIHCVHSPFACTLHLSRALSICRVNSWMRALCVALQVHPPHDATDHSHVGRVPPAGPRRRPRRSSRAARALPYAPGASAVDFRPKAGRRRPH